VRSGAARSGAGWRIALFASLLAGLLWPATAAAIPVFARIYDKPCHACHTVYPQLNPAGDAFRAHGLHGLTPAIQPVELAPYFSVPGTLPLALQFAVGEDVTHTQGPDQSGSTPAPYFTFPGTRPPALQFAVGKVVTHAQGTGLRSSTVTHFNFEFLSLLAGGELGPYLSFMADYAPYVTDPQTGYSETPTRPGLAYANAHAEPWDWLGNLTVGLFELPLGQLSMKVIRLRRTIAQGQNYV
jgi:hypothetical protein